MKKSENDREKSHEEMLEESYARPGTAEAIRVFGDDWGHDGARRGAYRGAYGPSREFAPGSADDQQ